MKMPHLPNIKINRSSLFATGFFVLSLITAVSITTNPLKTQLLGTFAKGKKNANDYGSPALRRSMGGGNVASSAPVVPDNGYTFSTVVNTAATGPDQTGWDCKDKGGCNSQAGDVSGYYESTPGSGKYYPIGGTGNDPNTYIKDSLAVQNGERAHIPAPPPGLTDADATKLYNFLNTGIGATSADIQAICQKVSTGCDTANLAQFAADELSKTPDNPYITDGLLKDYYTRAAKSPENPSSAPGSLSVPGLTSGDADALYSFLNTGVGVTSDQVAAICQKASSTCDTTHLAEFAANLLAQSNSSLNATDLLATYYKRVAVATVDEAGILKTVESVPGLTADESVKLVNFLSTGIGATSADIKAICKKVSTGCDTRDMAQFAATELKLVPEYKNNINGLVTNYRVRQAQLVGKQTVVSPGTEPGKYYLSCVNDSCPSGAQSSYHGSCACYVAPPSTSSVPGIVVINTESQDTCSTGANGRYYAYQPVSSECIISTNPLTNITTDQFKTLAIQNQIMTADQCAGVKRSSGASATWTQNTPTQGICSIQPIVPEVPTVRQGADCSGSCPSGGQYVGTVTGNSCTCTGLNTTIPTQVVAVTPAAPTGPTIPINPNGTFGQKDFPVTDTLPNGQPMPKQGCAPVAGANIVDTHGYNNITPDDFAYMIPAKYWSEKGLGAERGSALVQLLTNTGDFEGKSPFNFSYEPYTNATNLNVNSTGTKGIWNRIDNNDVVLIGVDAAKGTAGSGPNGQGIAHVTYMTKGDSFNNYNLESNDYFGKDMKCHGDDNGQGFSCSNNNGDTLHLPTNNQAVGILHPPPGN